MRTVIADLRYALRSLGKARGFSLAAVLTLAVGIGLNAAVFSAVYGVLLRPLDLPHSERLFSVWQDMAARGGQRQQQTGYAVFDDWRARNRCFTGLASFQQLSADLGGIDPPQRVSAGWVSHEYFSVLGVTPALGRGFLPEDQQERSGKPSSNEYAAPRKTGAVVLSGELWRRRFGSDPAILGRSITLEGMPVTVVGILPPGFRAPLAQDAEIWMVTPRFDPPPEDRPYTYLGVIGRLRPEVSPASAQAEMDRVAASIAKDHPATMHGVGASLQPARDAIAGAARKPLLLLLSAVLLVLLVACVNAGNLALSRALAREPELALRLALGAGRGRIAGLLAAESVVLAIGGAALGLLLGSIYLGLLRGLAPPQTPRLEAIRLDGGVVAVTCAASLAAGLCVGLLPVLWSVRRTPFQALREAAGATSGRRSLRWRGALIVAEIGASLLLLMGTGVLLRTLAALARVDLGFRTEKIVLSSLHLKPAHLPRRDDLVDFFVRLEDGLARRPEIAAVGVVSFPPLLSGDTAMGFSLEGQPAAAEERQAAQWNIASPGYFRAAGVPLLAGRLPAASDTATAPPVVLVSESFARRFLAGRPAVGRRLRSFENDGDHPPWLSIVGVVGDVRGRSLDRLPEPAIYVPLAQAGPMGATVVARAARSPSAALAAIREVVKQIRPGQVVAKPMTMEDVVDRGLVPRRFTAALLGSFAAVALLLAAVGIYGVTSLAVSQRRRELAVRLAMGAAPGSIARLVMRWIGLLVAAGVAAGIAAAFAAGKLIAGVLYGVRPMDASTLAAAGLLLATIAFGASVLPALRAARLDPAAILNGGE
jgi:predicted permease